MARGLSAARGCLIGGAIGDALGYSVEFLRWDDIRRRYGDRGIRCLQMDFDQDLALISDDTQMSLFTLNGLLSCEARMALGEAVSPVRCIYEAYLDWYRCQRSGAIPADNHSWLSELPEMHERRAPGNTCLGALGAGVPGSVEAPVNHSKGCGGIMRVAPIALWADGRLSIEEADMLAAQAAALTHGHPLGYMSAAALVDVIARALQTDGGDLYALAPACRDAMRALFCDDPYLDELLRVIDLAVELSRNGETDLENICRLGEGWTGEEALGIALYCALKYQDDFSGAVIAAVNHSGDSDSTGAIAGNIVGARLGDEAIDEKWLRGLELRDTILELAGDLCAGCPAPGQDSAAAKGWMKRYGARRGGE